MSASRSAGVNRIRMSETLVIVEADGDRAVCCRECGHRLCAADESSWKRHARLLERPMAGAGGAAYTTGKEVMLREFVCPGCAALLDVETALRGDPFLNDVLYL